MCRKNGDEREEAENSRFGVVQFSGLQRVISSPLVGHDGCPVQGVKVFPDLVISLSECTPDGDMELVPVYPVPSACCIRGVFILFSRFCAMAMISASERLWSHCVLEEITYSEMFCT